MIRIRRVHNSNRPSDEDRIRQVQVIFRHRFPGVAEQAEAIPARLDHPFRFGYRTVLLVAETALTKVTGFALVLHLPQVRASMLDFIAVAPGIRGGGIGSALYEAVREHCRASGSRGLYMEVLPDDPAVVHDGETLEENRKRLRFYEHYGVRPIVGTAYETPVNGGPAPHLLFDGLGREEPLGRDEARAAVRTILESKYAHLRNVTPEYVRRVVESFRDDPVRIRDPRYVRPASQHPAVAVGRLERSFGLIVTPEHAIHHVRERGYVERPARVGALQEAVAATSLFETVRLRHAGDDAITAVHDRGYVTYLRNVCEKLQPRRPVYPYVFPIRHPERPPKDLAIRAGYYCIDTFTPLDRNAYVAARAAVDVALTGAEEVVAGRRVAYAICRPPGHHAERRVFGGFCYFNNAAAAAHRLSRLGKVATLDIDFHHGNGTQDIFYERDDVLTVSIHGHPNYAYPYFSGFADETGGGRGQGCNRNFPLAEGSGEPAYLEALEKALRAIERFAPAFLVVCLGLDTMRGDPTGAFTLSAGSLERVGGRIGRLGLPTLVVQEGGYNLRNLKRGAPAFFTGLAREVAS